MASVTDTPRKTSDLELLPRSRSRLRWPDQDFGTDKKPRSNTRIGWVKDVLSYARTQAGREWILLKREFLLLLVCLVMQWVHLVATNVAYYMHIPREPLHDLGFAMLPALTPYQQVASEVLFWLIVSSTIAFALSPLVVCYARPVYSVQIFARYFAVCMYAQALRIVSFLVTILPSPNYHCRPDAPDYNPPRTLYAILNPLEKDPYRGCGDLVFSSHTIFVMLCVMTFVKYAPWMPKKYPISLALLFAVLVVMARKHYTVDVVVALYTVPLLWLAYEQIRPDSLPPELATLHENVYDDHDGSADRIEKEPLTSHV